jgi:glutamine amidotransferase
MISIINYGLGNLKAIANIYKRLNIPAEIINSREQLQKSSKIILPGVGSFDHAMNQLNHSGLRETLDELVLEKEIPVLGICVGLQMLAYNSDEGNMEGLNWIDANVRKFDVTKLNHATQLPHMGWNDVLPIKVNPLLAGLEKDAIFYFLHSYYFACNKSEDIIAECDYGIRYTCAVNHKNIYGVQFHPEKSHNYGIQLLNNFASL